MTYDRHMARPTKWTGSDEQQMEVDRLYREGASVKSLSRRYSCRANLVSDALRSRGHDVRRGRDKISPDRADVLVAKSREPGTTVRGLAGEFGMSEGAVSKLLHRKGEPPRINAWTPELQQQVVERYRSGESQQRIADDLGVGQPSVSARLREAGVVVRRPVASGEAHGSWKGGRVVQGGYIYVRPTADDLAYCRPNGSGYVSESRLVMGRALGRPLTDDETVHHINLDHSDNAPKNLQLRRGQHGTGAVLVCRACGSHDVEAVALAEAGLV